MIYTQGKITYVSKYCKTITQPYKAKFKVLGDEVELTSLCINMPYCAWGIASSSPTWECL
jgi:hypothetical protein